MDKIKSLVSLVLCFILVLSFAACGSKDNEEKTTTTTTTTTTATTEQQAPAKPANKLSEGELMLTLYADRSSADYKSVKSKPKRIETGINPEADAGYFKFVSPVDGVKVKLEAIEWSPIVDGFEAVDTLFEVTAEKDKVYEFECYVTETIPDFRLVAECGEFSADYYMVVDGYEVVTKLLMLAQRFSPDEITQDSAFYQLCVARAVSDVFYNDRLIRYEPEVVWNTLAYAVTLNEFKMNGTEDYVNMIGLSDWEADAYFRTLYPSLDESKVKLMEDGRVVAAHFSVGKKYLVEPHLFDKFCSEEFYGVEKNKDGTYSVKILIHDQRAPDVEFDRDRGLAVIVKVDANSPFGYSITDVVDYDLPKG